MPGDRRNEDIAEAGRICARSFNRLYIKEDNDLRGRDAGEVADLLYNAAVMEGMEPGNISIIYSETLALETAIMEAKPGDFIAVFYEELDSALKAIEKCRVVIGARNAGKSEAGAQNVGSAAG